MPLPRNNSAASDAVNARSSRADVGDLTVDPHPVQAQRRVGAGGQHQPQLRRLMFQQLTERLQHPPVGDVVDVVQHQDHRVGEIGQRRADQLDLVGAEPGGRHDLPQGAVGGHGVADRERPEHVGPERLNVVVGLFHGQPRHLAGDRRPPWWYQDASVSVFP